MGLLDLFNKKDKPAFEPISNKTALSKVLNGDLEFEDITREMAMQIPALKAGVGLISDLIASLEIKLYKEINSKVESVDDYRLKLLNDETGDTLNSYQMKQSLVRDFLLSGNGYAYINKTKNKIKSLHYVKPNEVSVLSNSHPIFKDSKLNVLGEEYEAYDFVIFAQNSIDGVTGKGILDENSDLLDLSHSTLKFAASNMAQGGIKRGVLKSAKRLSEEAMTALKTAWANLYSSDNTSNVIILNEGLEFHELSQTSAELQVMENRKNNDKDILNILKVPANILDGTATNEQYNNFIKSTIVPILGQLESAFNKSLLLENEKENGYFFSFETKDLLKGSAKERFETYKVAIESGVITPNEARFMENYDNIEGLDVIKLSLGHVLFDPKTGEYYVPNTGEKSNGSSIEQNSPDTSTEDVKGGEK